MCLTLTSLPFYFYRIVEILFDAQISSNYYDVINSRVLAQIILFGISFKPILYFILLTSSKILFKFKCYTSIQIERIDQIDNELNQQTEHHRQGSQSGRYSLKLYSFYPKLHINLQRLSVPVKLTNHHHLNCIDQNPIEISNDTDL
jgi:hypothetical protein